MNAEQIVKKIIAEALSKNDVQAEVFLKEDRSTSIEVKKQTVDAFEVSSSHGASLRILKDQRVGFAYSSELDSQGIERLVSQALNNARNNDPDPFVSFSQEIADLPDLGIYDESIGKISEAEKIAVAKRIEKSALDHDKRIEKVRSASYSDSENTVYLANSFGVNIFWKETLCSTAVDLIAREGENSETGSDFGSSRFFNQLKIEETGAKAAGDAVSMLGAKPITSCDVPVVLNQEVASDFLEVLSNSLLADSVQKGKSMLAGKIGSNIASSLVNITDNGLLDQGIKTTPTDHEGSPSRSTRLISKGVLQGYLHNIHTAQKGETKSTGNGVRRGFKAPPEVGVTNLYIENGFDCEDTLIEEIDKGFYVVDAMGVHTADPISGDFSIGVSGFRIEKGEKIFPVRGVAIAGNILELFKNINGVGSDIRFFAGIGSPSLRISNMVISGTG